MGKGHRLVVRCIVCNCNFSPIQRNYKTCSQECRIAYLKFKHKMYYINNRNSIINRVSSNKKAKPANLICIVCRMPFINRKGTKCCSESCRSELNHFKNKAKYKYVDYRLTCVSCGLDFYHRRNKKTCSSFCYQKYKTVYMRNRYRTDIQFKISSNIRSRITHAVRGAKPSSTLSELGCSIDYLVKYLESKFSLKMSWNNYGKWHIDHIKPLSSFDLSDPEQFKQACHYSNLQPMWAKDNLRKGNR